VSVPLLDLEASAWREIWEPRVIEVLAIGSSISDRSDTNFSPAEAAKWHTFSAMDLFLRHLKSAFKAPQRVKQTEATWCFILSSAYYPLSALESCV
jgi:hypothetical protein